MYEKKNLKYASICSVVCIYIVMLIWLDYASWDAILYLGLFGINARKKPHFKLFD